MAACLKVSPKRLAQGVKREELVQNPGPEERAVGQDGDDRDVEPVPSDLGPAGVATTSPVCVDTVDAVETDTPKNDGTTVLTGVTNVLNPGFDEERPVVEGQPPE